MKLNNISKKQWTQSIGAAFCLSLLSGVSYAAPVAYKDCQAVTLPNGASGFLGHPCPQNRPGPSAQVTEGGVTSVITPEGQHPAQSPFDEPPGSNFLLTKYENLKDFNGNEMPNTLPSTEDGRYNLHDGPVLTEKINKKSPNDDLDKIIDKIERIAKRRGRANGRVRRLAQRGIDILEGNPIRNRAYSGFPMLHYNGPNKVGVVKPICAGGPCSEPLSESDVVIGGNVDVEMLYWDQHIEADTAFIDPSAVQNVPWTITYKVNILKGGIEDFSPMTMHFDLKPDGSRGPFNASMDQSYFPMLKEGTRYTVKVKQTLGKYYNLTYTWGWRVHPPRVQVTENALKAPRGRTLPEEEILVFGENPRGSEENKLAAIAMIGDISPAKRMWNLFKELKEGRGKKQRIKYRKGKDNKDRHVYRYGKKKGKNKKILKRVSKNLRAAFLDWSDRTKLPAGVEADPDSTITLLYANNTIYGSRQGLQGEGSGQGPASYKGICNGCAHDWNVRPYEYRVTLYNGDKFEHGYMNVDFGGSRGWENQFQFTDPTTALAKHDHTDNTVIFGRHTQVDEEGNVIDTDSNVNVIDDHNILLDLTTNPAKEALRVDQSTGETIVSNDKVFPMNTGGLEEFLEPTPRSSDINDDPQFGSGCFFTFGRNYAWPNAGGPWGGIFVPPVSDEGELGKHIVEIQYNFEPSRRLRVYQFDPIHHDVAIYSLH